MIALEDLVIGVTNYFKVFINKSFMNGSRDRCKLNGCLQVFKDAVQPLQLFGVFGKKKKAEAFTDPLLQVFDEQVELAVECRLGTGGEVDRPLPASGLPLTPSNGGGSALSPSPVGGGWEGAGD